MRCRRLRFASGDYGMTIAAERAAGALIIVAGPCFPDVPRLPHEDDFGPD